MIVRKLRLKKGWSQEQLATLTGLNVRTVQRIERGQAPSLESKRALAAVFDIGIEVLNEPENVTQTNTENAMTTNTINNIKKPSAISNEEKLALQYAKSIKEFYTHLFLYAIFVPIIVATKGITDPQALMIAAGWTVGIIFHGLVAHEKITIFTPNWERKLVEKKLGRKL